jgi:hypothetical protein
MIIKGSRYTQSSETRNDTTVYVADNATYRVGNYFTIVAEDGDSFEFLASRYLNNPQMYWKLADINTHVPFPDFIEAGTSIKIPLS